MLPSSVADHLDARGEIVPGATTQQDTESARSLHPCSVKGRWQPKEDDHT